MYFAGSKDCVFGSNRWPMRARRVFSKPCLRRRSAITESSRFGSLLILKCLRVTPQISMSSCLGKSAPSTSFFFTSEWMFWFELVWIELPWLALHWIVPSDCVVSACPLPASGMVLVGLVLGSKPSCGLPVAFIFSHFFFVASPPLELVLILLTLFSIWSLLPRMRNRSPSCEIMRALMKALNHRSMAASSNLCRRAQSTISSLVPWVLRISWESPQRIESVPSDYRMSHPT